MSKDTNKPNTNKILKRVVIVLAIVIVALLLALIAKIAIKGDDLNKTKLVINNNNVT